MRQFVGDTHGGLGQLAAGEAVSEERVGNRGSWRKVEGSGKSLSAETREADINSAHDQTSSPQVTMNSLGHRNAGVPRHGIGSVTILIRCSMGSIAVKISTASILASAAPTQK